MPGNRQPFASTYDGYLSSPHGPDPTMTSSISVPTSLMNVSRKLRMKSV